MATEREPNSNSNESPFSAGVTLAYQEIEEKYIHGPRPQQEARHDALTYTINVYADSLYDSVYPDDPELNEAEIENAEIERKRLEHALKGARQNDWKPMKATMQAYARSILESSSYMDLISERLGYQLNTEGTEEIAQVFINLAASL